jgi:adenylylsulfate kinase
MNCPYPLSYLAKLLQSTMEKRGVTIWFTGLSGAGKTTISEAVAARIDSPRERLRQREVVILDGDRIRQTITTNLGFSPEDRAENIRQIGRIARKLTIEGSIVLVAAIAPYRYLRDELREQIGAFVEVYVNASLEVCEARDTKGLYRRARAGEIDRFTGIDDPYEAPLNPEVVCYTDRESIEESVDKVINYLTRIGVPAIEIAASDAKSAYAD